MLSRQSQWSKCVDVSHETYSSSFEGNPMVNESEIAVLLKHIWVELVIS